MPDRIEINDQITVGAQPSEAELKAMADAGYRSIINLRTDDEKMQRIDPEQEGRLARDFGLEYEHIPVSMEDADQALVDRFRQKLHSAPKPTYVHCRLGKRAGAFTMMDKGVEQGESGGQVLQEAEELGFECDEQQLAEFVKQYVNQRS